MHRRTAIIEHFAGLDLVPFSLTSDASSENCDDF